MPRFAPRTLRQRVFLALLPLVVLLVGSGSAGTALVWHLGHLSGEILRENYTSVIAMERLNEALENIDSSFQYALAGQPEPARAQYEASWKHYRENLLVEQSSITVPGEREAVAKLNQLTEQYRVEGQAFYAESERRLRRDRYTRLEGLLELFRELKSLTIRIRDLNQASMEAASLRARSMATLSATALFVSLVLSLGLAGVSAWSTSTTLVAPIRALTRAMVGIGEGKLEQGASASGSEELEALTRAFNSMVDKLRASRSAVEQSTAELRALNSELEHRVELRTADLREARQREAAIGTKIQQQLLLDEPPRDLEGLAVAALTVPAQQIAGDFYGFFRYERSDCLDWLVADVMGKGVPAALLSAATKSYFPEALWHLLATCPSNELPEPRDIVTLAHTQMAEQLIDIESFVTLCYARIDVVRRRLWLVDCGHTGALIWHARSGSCTIVHGDNLPLGVRQGEIYGQSSVPLETDDLVILYSDGVTEARSSAGELFGTERLMACVHDHAAREPAEIVAAVRNAVVAFSSSGLADDLTCVVVKVLPHQPATQRRDIVLGSDLSDLREGREFIASFCRGLEGRALSDDGIARLTLAVNEALSNVMKHAYHGRKDQRIELRAEAYTDRVAVRLRYQGAVFDASQVPLPAFDGSREGGFGVFMIQSSVDVVRYYRDDLRRSCVRLEVKREAA